MSYDDKMFNGVVYCLKSFQTDKIYVGSTTTKLKQRFCSHKSTYRAWTKGKMNYVSSFDLVKFDDCYIEIIKEVYATKLQLKLLENEEINKNQNCCNRNNAVYNIEDRKNYHRQYKKAHYIKKPPKVFNMEEFLIKSEIKLNELKLKIKNKSI